MLSILVLTSLAACVGLLLSYIGQRYRAGSDPLLEQIMAELPQTQCAQCDYPGCRPYAEALIDGELIDKCVPGGEQTLRALAQLLGKPLPTTAALPTPQTTLALIEESQCIGCYKCIEACPVDAIIGAPRHMHTVLKDICTGCALCIAPCPVDCISLLEIPIMSDQVKTLAPPLADAMPAELACIACAQCAQYCPINLQPQHLLSYAKAGNHQQLAHLHLDLCIECGICNKVCPSHIPLVEHFQTAKMQIGQNSIKRQQAIDAQSRFEARQRRLSAQQAKPRSIDNKLINKQAIIQAALSRVKAKKQQGNQLE